MPLFTAVPLERDEVRRFEHREMLGDRLSGHVEPIAQFPERLAVFRMKPVEQRSAARICQSPKDGVVIHVRTSNQMIPYPPICNFLVACQAPNFGLSRCRDTHSRLLRETWASSRVLSV